MNGNDQNDFIALVQPIFSLYGQEASMPMLRLWLNALNRFPLDIVREAFNRHVQDPKTGRFAPKPADIIGAIELMMPSQRLSADEAWGIYPHDEASSAVITDEMAEAMSSAQYLLDEGDKIAGRMAFKSAYDRIVARNKSAGIMPKWFPTLGADPAGREEALKQAVQLGRLSHDHAQSLLPSPKDSKLLSVMPQLQMLTQKQELTEEQKQSHAERMAEIREMLKGSNG